MRRFFALLAAGLACVLALAGPIPAGRAAGAAAPLREGSVKLSAQAGFDGRASLDRWAPVVVQVINQGGAQNGELVVRQALPGGSVAAYALPLPLPEGARKRVALHVPAQGGGRGVEVAYEVSGQPLASVEASISVAGPQDVVVGVLSREPLALDALGQVKLAGRTGSVRLIRLEPDALPDSLTLLDNFDVLALVRFPSARLAPTQRQALSAWVRRGGLLVLVAGPEWQSTLGGLPRELVPVEPTGTRPVHDLPVLAALGGKELPGRGRPIALTTARLREARPLIQDGPDPVIASARLGQGVILYVGVDLTLDPFASWTGGATLWETLLLQYRGGGLWSPRTAARGNPSLMARVLEAQPMLPAPPLRALTAGLVAYVLALGPVGYGLVALLRRRQWFWVWVPLVSAVVVGLLYWRGFGVERRAVMARSVSITELAGGLPVAASRSYLAVFAPSRQRMEIGLSPGDLAAPLAFPEQVPERVREVTRVRLGNPPVVELEGLTMWGLRGLLIDREVSGLEGLLVDLTIRGGRLDGTVRNGGSRSIRKPVLITPAGHESLPDLPPGASARVQTSLVGYRRPWQPVFQEVFGSGAGLAPDQGEQLFRRQVLEAAMGPTRDSLPGSIVLLGWLDDAPAPVLSEGSQIAGTHLLYQVVLPRVDPADYDIPPGLVVGRLVGAEGTQRGRSPRGFYLQEGALTFSMQVPDIDRSLLREVELIVETGGPAGSARVKLLNWRTGAWEEMPKAGEAPLTPERWDAFLARDGSLLVRVEVDKEGQEVRAPTIALRGGR